MKRSILPIIALICLVSGSTSAAVPQLINYQGVLADSTGAGLDTTVNITFSIYDAAVSGSLLWTETQGGIIVTGGIFNVLLGSVLPLDVLIFASPIGYLGITIGADPEITPRSQLVSVPYSFSSEHATEADLAFFADTAGAADILDSLSSEDFSRTSHSHSGGGGGWTDDGNSVRLETGTDSVGIGTSTPTAKLDVDGDVNVSGKATIGPGITSTGVNAFAAGEFHTVSGDYSTISGGSINTASGKWTTVSGGQNNKVTADYSTIGGGFNNIVDTLSATVAGGNNNTASGKQAAIGGGMKNVASSQNATVGGGSFNTASGRSTTIGGGGSNTADNDGSTVGGGSNNSASGVMAIYATISGGLQNTANGQYSTVPGGRFNTAAGSYSFAAGLKAYANHHGSFVWADSTDVFFISTAQDQFRVRASGGTEFFSNTALTAGVTLAAGASSWSAVSDSTLKRNIREVDYQDVLQKVVELPISQWSFKSQDENLEHIGPMAQDFYRLFGLGEDDKHINTLDPDGIALAAIKALHKENQDLRERLQKLEERFKLLTD